MKIKVVDTVWTIKRISDDEFQKKFGEGEALTATDTNVIYFRKERITLRTITHELFHAYYDSTLTSSADLTGDQGEEVSAELISKYGKQLLQKSEQLYRRLK